MLWKWLIYRSFLKHQQWAICEVQCLGFFVNQIEIIQLTKISWKIEKSQNHFIYVYLI